MSFLEAPKVFIILLNWNGSEDTIECVHSLRKLRYPSYEIIIVDNDSRDDSVAAIGKEFPEIKILELSENRGYAGGNNAGIHYALENGAQYIWILNNDTVVDENALQPLVEKMEEDASIGICGSLLVYYHQRRCIQAMGGGYYKKWLGITRTCGDQKPLDAIREAEQVEENLDFIAGAAMMVSRKFVETVGLMNEEYFLYYEELDWALRGKKSFNLGFAPDSIVYHKHAASINKELKSGQKRSKIAEYYQIKNRLKFTWNYFPYCLPTVYLTVIYALFDRMKEKQWDRAAMILKLMATFNQSIILPPQTDESI